MNEVFDSSEGFYPEDICVQDLHENNAQLAGEWRSEQLMVGEGWMKTVVKIFVPDELHHFGENDASMLKVPHCYRNR